MNRRQAITATATAVAASLLRPDALRAQSSGAMAVPPEGETLYLNPLGSDANPGTRERPLLTLAAAARRVNESRGSGPMTIVLSEGVYAVGEQATFKPDNRTFTRTGRLTIRAEVLPDDPGWHTGRMPTLIHTLPLKDHWNGRKLPPGTGATLGFKDIDASFIELVNTRVSREPLTLEMDESLRGYLHPLPGTEAARIGAGLFMKPIG